MRDYLLDIVRHTHALGFIDLIKIEGSDTATTLNAMADDRSVIITAKFSKPQPEFNGVYGLPFIGALNFLLGVDEFQHDLAISMVHNDANEPSNLHFVGTKDDFWGDYRFMSGTLVNEKIKPMKFNEPKYDVVLEPDVISIRRLKIQSQMNGDESTFVAVVKNGNLTFSFGDQSSNAGAFVFATNTSPRLKTAWKYPIAQTLGILSLDGDKEMKFSNNGALVITVNSGLIEYQYIIPAFTK